MERVGVTNYPLYWPSGWERTRSQQPARFGPTNVYRETQHVRAELERLGAKGVVVSSNILLRQDGIPYSGQKGPKDAGIAVWFWLPRVPVPVYEKPNPKNWSEHVLACDRWVRAEHNLRAIALHVAAMRGQERWGVGSVAQAFRGYAALPERAAGGIVAWQVLGIPREGSTIESVTAAFKREARKAHPDAGGTREQWDALVAARAEALMELGG